MSASASGPVHASAPAAMPASAWTVVEILAACPGVVRVRLFGSRARGDHAAGSDVDFAIDAPTLAPRDRARLAADANEAATLYPFDLVWVAEASDALRARIDTDGILLYDREDTAAPRPPRPSHRAPR